MSVIEDYYRIYGSTPSVECAQKFLKENGVESNLVINQPWIVWRKETSNISLSETEEIINFVFGT